MSSYRAFVKANFHKLPADMKATEKMKKIGAMWRARKAGGGGLFGDIGNAVDGVSGLFGLGLKPKRGRGRPRKNAKGAGFFSKLGDGMMNDVIMRMVGGAMHKKKGARKTRGAGFNPLSLLPLLAL